MFYYYNDNKNLIIPLQDKDFIGVLNTLKDEYNKDSYIPQEKMLNALTKKIILS